MSRYTRAFPHILERIQTMPSDKTAPQASEANEAVDTDRPLVLVDGSAYLYRAFHAMPPLTNSKGQPTGAIYGVVNMLRRLVADYQPRYMAVIFDASGKTFRDDIYSEYKANRASMPDDMRAQIKPLHDVVQTMGFPLLSIGGVEADDVIGTLCVRASEKGLKTIVSTGDKDMAQLVNEHVTLVNTMTSTSMDVQGVIEKFGVPPEQIIDYLALVGDTSDNIPGVPSCGPKTAVKWLAAHGSLQNIIDNADSVKGKIGEKLREAIAHLPMSYDLATIRLDVELDTAVDQLTLNAPDEKALAQLYEDLEFRTWAKELADGMSPLQTRAAQGGAPAVADAPADSPDNSDYETIYDMVELDRWIDQLENASLFAFDTETTSLDYMQAQIVGLSFALPEGRAAYVPLAHDYEDAPEQLDRDAVLKKIDVDIASAYAAEDADITLKLFEVLWPKLKAEPTLLKLYEQIEIPALHVLSRIERTGVKIDDVMLAKQGKKLSETISEVKAAAFEDAGREFNLGSPKQIGEIFFEEKQFPIIRKTPKGQPSTAEDVLEQLALDYPLPRLILQHRSLTKLMSTYIEKLPLQINPDSGRVHTSYNQAIASTGRLSSTDPNLQNIPVRTEEGRRIREAFVAEEGYRLLAADYSQIELRIMAHLSEDDGLLNAFDQGIDVHKATAAEVFGVPLEAVEADQRRSAKAINFGLIYGMSAFGLAKQLDIGRGEAQEYINLYFERYPGVKRYMDETRALAKDQGYVETVLGRRLYLPDINARNAQMRNYAERTAINAPMQGTAADIIKRAMIDVNQWLVDDKVDARIIMQVHDELVLEVVAGQLDDVGAHVSALMIKAATLKVELEVDVGIGNSWEEAH